MIPLKDMLHKQEYKRQRLSLVEWIIVLSVLVAILVALWLASKMPVLVS